MKTLDEVIKGLSVCYDVEGCYACPQSTDYGGCDVDWGYLTKDALHYLIAYRQLSRGFVGENTEIRPEGIYCKVCGTRLDKDWDDENA